MLIVPNYAIIGVILFSTVAFAINTFDMFSLFYLIAEDFKQDLALLGLIALTMTIGIGVSQIPAGLIAARYGSKVVAIIGTLIVGSFSLLVGASTDGLQIAALRFAVGIGLAFAFPSMMSIIVNHFNRKAGGFAVGTVAGAYSAGGIIGLIVWVLFAQQVGWRSSIEIAGILSLLSAVLIQITVPKGEVAKAAVREMLVQVRSILSHRVLILLGVLLLASQIAFEQALAFMPFYLQNALTVDPALAGLVGSLTLVAALVGAPATGWLYDRKIGISKLGLLLGSVLLVGLSMNMALSLDAAIISTLLVGFAGGGLFTLFSNAAREQSSNMAERSFATLSINWVHAIAITGTFWAPVMFASLALTLGYTIAWPLIGIISFGLLISSLAVGHRKVILLH